MISISISLNLSMVNRGGVVDRGWLMVGGLRSMVGGLGLLAHLLGHLGGNLDWDVLAVLLGNVVAVLLGHLVTLLLGHLGAVLLGVLLANLLGHLNVLVVAHLLGDIMALFLGLGHGLVVA